MIKKILAAALVLSSFGWMLPVVAAANSPFPDVAAGSEHAAAVTFLKEKGIVKGYVDGSFKPDQTINRAEALKIVFLARQSMGTDDKSVDATASFPDVKAGDWFAAYVGKAVKLGIVKGYDDGTFKPADPITAAESLKVAFSGLVANFQVAAVTEKPFTDVGLDKWYAAYLDYGKKQQFIEARSDGSYNPERQMSRVDFAEVIYRVMYTQSNQLDVYPLNLNWQACNNYQEGYKIKKPFAWDIVPAGDEMIFWRKDVANGQVSFARIYPNSGVAVVAVDANSHGLTLDQYMKQIEYGAGSNMQTTTLNGLAFSSVYIEQSGLQDNYFQLPSGKILAIYAQIGDGALGWQLKQELRYIIASVRESNGASAEEVSCLGVGGAVQSSAAVVGGAAAAGSSSGSGSGSAAAAAAPASVSSAADQTKASILQMILVKGKSEAALALIDDEVLIETDSIGIGTGPVDYYYSAKLNLTLKIDRNSATLLASKDGKTTAF